MLADLTGFLTMPEPEVPPGSGNMDTMSGDANASGERKRDGANGVGSAPGNKWPGSSEVNQRAGGPAQAASDEEVRHDAAREQGEGAAMEDGTGPGGVAVEVDSPQTSAEGKEGDAGDSGSDLKPVTTNRERLKDLVANALQGHDFEGKEVVANLIVENMVMTEATSLMGEALASFNIAVSSMAEELVRLRPYVHEALTQRVQTVSDQLIDQVTGSLVAQGFDHQDTNALQVKAMEQLRALSLGEDEPDKRLWSHFAIDRAVACSVEPPNMATLAYVLAVNGDVATVLHGVNQLSRVVIPGGAKQEERDKCAPGKPVFLHERELLTSEGGTKSVFSLARGDLLLEQHHHENLPSLRAVVQSYRRGFGGVVTGEAHVPATGSVVTYLATKERGPERWPVGTVFLFSPVFEASDVEALGDVCPVLENVDDATLLYAPDVSGRALALHSRTELVDGFYSPNKALQTFLSLRFGVNASLYTGEESTSLKYYGGGELFKRALTKLERAPSRALNLKLREVEKLMAKVSVYKECKSGGEAPDVAKLKSSMCDPMVHVAIPTQGNLLSFGGYLQQQMQASARTGDRFQICVGVLVDEFATTSCVYNTEHCLFFDPRAFPWAKSFTLLEGDYVISEYNPDASELLPAVEAMRGRKLLLVELDSSYQAKGCLPYPQSMKLDATVAKAVSAEADPSDKEVLVGMHQHDPRVLELVRDCGASFYKIVDDTTILALNFDTPKKARDFISDMKESKAGVFVMTRQNLYAKHAYTLTCNRPAVADELFVLLDAVEVMSIGKNRYRFTSNQTLLKHAQVLYRHNRWKKNEKVKKFRALRDDSDRYVFLDHKLPVSLNMYQRAPPLSPACVEGKAPGLFWYRLTNLPRNLSDAKLRDALEQWGGLGEVKEWKIDRAHYNPTLWMAVAERVAVARVVNGVFDRTNILLPVSTPPTRAKALSLVEQAYADPAARILSRGRQQEFEVGAATSRILKLYQGGQRPVVPPNSVYRPDGSAGGGSVARGECGAGREAKANAGSRSSVAPAAKAAPKASPKAKGRKSAESRVRGSPNPKPADAAGAGKNKAQRSISKSSRGVSGVEELPSQTKPRKNDEKHADPMTKGKGGTKRGRSSGASKHAPIRATKTVKGAREPDNLRRSRDNPPTQKSASQRYLNQYFQTRNSQ